MGTSIQDYLKKINSNLSFSDTTSIALTALFLLLLSLYFSVLFEKRQVPVTYRTSSRSSAGEDMSADARPFGSKSGTTYTYSWCQGSDRIKEANKVYYANAASAENSGRQLSKLCQK